MKISCFLYANMNFAKLTLVFSILISIVGVKSCTKEGEKPPFEATPEGVLLSPQMNEISGIAYSNLFGSSFWGIEDSGNGPFLHLINKNGTITRSVFLANAVNRDWEEVAEVGDSIYIAETGDNNEAYTSYRYYRLTELAAAGDTANNIQTIEFIYGDGSHDSEAFVVDPQTGSIYIITKRDNPSRLYRLKAPLNTSGLTTAEYLGDLSLTNIVAATLSKDGKEVLMKTYSEVWYGKREAGASLESLLKGKLQKLSYETEPQGEAISFGLPADGFFTLSEKPFNNPVYLNHYKRK